jgi:hypothetical protein
MQARLLPIARFEPQWPISTSEQTDVGYREVIGHDDRVLIVESLGRILCSGDTALGGLRSADSKARESSAFCHGRDQAIGH